MKVNITVDDDLMKQIDNEADRMYTSRSGFFTLAATNLLDAHNMMRSMQDLAVCFRRIADSNEIDENSKRELEHFEYLAKSLSVRQ